MIQIKGSGGICSHEEGKSKISEIIDVFDKMFKIIFYSDFRHK